MRTLEGSQTRRNLLPILPVLMARALLFVYPLLGIVNRSVYKDGYTLQFYRQIFRIPVYLQVLAATFKVSAVVTIVCLVLGYPPAYLPSTRPPRTAQLLMIIVVLPLFTRIIVPTSASLVLLRRNGLANHHLTPLR